MWPFTRSNKTPSELDKAQDAQLTKHLWIIQLLCGKEAAIRVFNARCRKSSPEPTYYPWKLKPSKHDYSRDREARAQIRNKWYAQQDADRKAFIHRLDHPFEYPYSRPVRDDSLEEVEIFDDLRDEVRVLDSYVFGCHREKEQIHLRYVPVPVAAAIPNEPEYAIPRLFQSPTCIPMGHLTYQEAKKFPLMAAWEAVDSVWSRTWALRKAQRRRTRTCVWNLCVVDLIPELEHLQYEKCLTRRMQNGLHKFGLRLNTRRVPHNLDSVPLTGDQGGGEFESLEEFSSFRRLRPPVEPWMFVNPYAPPKQEEEIRVPWWMSNEDVLIALMMPFQRKPPWTWDWFIRKYT